jgi:CPA2 family monovalent cation:H+ antiporter-2
LAFPAPCHQEKYVHGATGFLESAALLVCAAFMLVTFCSRIGVPSIVGYIFAGIVVGPAGLNLVAESEALAGIGEIGVVLLLFALGLEFSFERLVNLRRHVFGLGALQVVITTATVSLVASLTFDLAPVSAILVGGAVAMSSTAMCLKVLASVNALGSAQGRLAIAAATAMRSSIGGSTCRRIGPRTRKGAERRLFRRRWRSRPNRP